MRENIEGYIFISNFINTRKDKIWHMASLKAAEIADYIVTDNAVDCFGNPLENTWALYFKDTVSVRDRELFYQALLIASDQMKERRLRG